MGKRKREGEAERAQGRRADKSNANSYLLLCKDTADGRAWPGLICKWKAGPSLSRAGVWLPCARGNDAGCPAIPQRVATYVMLETGNETRRSRPPLTEVVQYST